MRLPPKRLVRSILIAAVAATCAATFVSAQYCTPTYSTGCAYGDGLTLFQLNTINQSISCSGSPAWYHDYTATSTQLQAGTPYTLTVQSGYSSTYVSVWVDLDNNDTFDTTERVAQLICSASATNYTATITIPTGTSAGDHRIRFMTEWISYPSGPCSSQTYGNAGDFTIDVVTSSATGTTTTVMSSLNPSIHNQSVTFTATVAPVSGSGTPTGTVQFQADGANIGSPVTLSGAVATLTTSTLTAGTHPIAASYGGDTGFSSSSGSLSGGQVVNAFGAAANIVPTGGTPQSATVNSAFSNALQATVTDSLANPVAGATVTFTAPASGASGTFPGGTTATAGTDSSGVATSPTFTANSIGGGYQVLATVNGVTNSAAFDLTNIEAAKAIPALSGFGVLLMLALLAAAGAAFLRRA